MITPEELAEAFARSCSIIKAQTIGLTHADSLLQPPFRGNCMNWVLGHILDTRNGVLKVLGEMPVSSETDRVRPYGHGSEPVCSDGEGVLKLEQLLKSLESSQSAIEARLKRISPEELVRETRDHRGPVTVAQRLLFLYFHETYHVGQTELLRQLAGANDHVI